MRDQTWETGRIGGIEKRRRNSALFLPAGEVSSVTGWRAYLRCSCLHRQKARRTVPRKEALKTLSMPNYKIQFLCLDGFSWKVASLYRNRFLWH